MVRVSWFVVFGWVGLWCLYAVDFGGFVFDSGTFGLVWRVRRVVNFAVFSWLLWFGMAWYNIAY